MLAFRQSIRAPLFVTPFLYLLNGSFYGS